MRRPLPTLAPLTFIFFVGCASAHAQVDRADRGRDDCDRNNYYNGYGDRRERFCEMRTFTIAAGRSLTVDGRDNGSVRVHGWDGSETKVTATIQTQANSRGDAEAMAKDISVAANGSEVRATGPRLRGRDESWSVSYEIWTPRHTDLTLTSTNGGVSVDGVDSRMDLETVNGGLTLVDVEGDVRGRTSNGGVRAELSGDRWRGAGLDLRTSNGGVRIYVPRNYSARLETGTVNGGINVDFPITVQGSVGRRLDTTLGSGGATIRATTTNGAVSVLRR